LRAFFVNYSTVIAIVLPSFRLAFTSGGFGFSFVLLISRCDIYKFTQKGGGGARGGASTFACMKILGSCCKQK